MFGKSVKISVESTSPPPVGFSDVIYCVFDEKRRLRHYFRSERDDGPEERRFKLLEDPAEVFDSRVFAEAAEAREPVSIDFSFDDGARKYIFVLPYARKRDKWRFACLQVITERAKPDEGTPRCASALMEGRVCLLLANEKNEIVSTSSRIPESFGYSPEHLRSMNLIDLFTSVDVGMISSCSADSNESILSCVLRCLDGSKRDVEVRKYSSTDNQALYCLFDVTRARSNKELSQIGDRERRRIGQDLHDSIGQLLTGISLLSSSLASNLRRAEVAGDADARRISELADEASEQVRQISRGLMPADIVHRGLFASLRDLAKTTTDCCGLACEASLDENVTFADRAIETHLFRIAQEAVNNAVRHSGANRVDIRVSESDGSPLLMIQDNGSWRNIMENSGGIGLKTMQYRASAVNGRLRIEKGEGGGTVVVCRIETDELFETKA